MNSPPIQSATMRSWSCRERTLLWRWLAFNFVGAIGIGIQLTVLVLLRSMADLHYLLATVLAVETAILHNFAWHERWTWLDRTAHDRKGAIGRLIRFNLTTGAISLGGNALFMIVLVSGLGLHYLLANIIAITLCSVLNFLAGDRLVFKKKRTEPPFATSVETKILQGSL